MNKKAGAIITGVFGVAFLAAAVVVFFLWQNDVKYYEAQLAEYVSALDKAGKSMDGNSGELNEAKQQIAQLEADLQAYNEAIDKVNAERVAAKEESEAKEKAQEEAWNALTDTQRAAITKGIEKSKLTNYLLYNSEEYAELYTYLRDLASKGFVELSKSEYNKYKEVKTRMTELEAEAEAILGASGE